MRRVLPAALLTLMLITLGSVAPAALAGTEQPATPGAGTPAAGTPAAGDLAITSSELIDGDAGVALAISPDGRNHAVARPDAGEVCAVPTVTREAPTCVGFEPASRIAPGSVSWSPDGTRFTFTEDLFIRLEESDVYVFDTGDASITNLTDDGVEGSVLDLPDGAEADVDIAPSWSPDGTEIVFARSVRSGDGFGTTTSLHRVSAGGGEPERVTVVAPDYALAVLTTAWPTDDTILYAFGPAARTDDDGIWQVSPDGGDPERIVDASGEGDGPVALVGVTRDGAYGLLLNLGAAGVQPQLPTFGVADLETGDVIPVEVATDQPVPTFIAAAAFSPDGGSLLFAATPPGETPSLVLRDLATGEDRTVGELDRPVGAPGIVSGMTWADNGFVLVAAGGNTSLLLTLGTD